MEKKAIKPKKAEIRKPAKEVFGVAGIASLVIIPAILRAVNRK